MILQHLMEEKQLDFNQPLLSVRRFPSTAATENDASSTKPPPPPPVYKSDLKSGPIRNPGTVPFVWEQTPGRPKDERKVQTQWPSVTPKLPPGRVSRVKQQHSEEVSKARSVRQSRTGSTVASSPNLATSVKEEEIKQERLKEAIQEKEASSGSNSDDDDETYVDAVDTLSRTESFFMNCSVSGLSGLDDQEVQPSGSSATDQQARDFMIGRFLPAAKAMASETPQYTSRKPHVTQEQLRQINKVAHGENPHPLNPKWQKVLPHYAQDIGREESEDESDDDDVSVNYEPKVCGLFPRFCLLTPLPGLRMEDRVLSSPGHRMQGKSIASHRRITKEHARTAYSGKKSVDSQSGFTVDKNLPGITEKSKNGIDPHRRGFSKSLDHENTQCESSCESPVVEKTLYVDSVHKVKSSSSCFEMKVPTNHGGDDLEIFRKDSAIDKNASIDSSLEDSKYSGVVDEKATVQSKSSVSPDSSLLICSDKSSNDSQIKITSHSSKVYLEKQELTNPGYQGSNFDNDLVATSNPKTIECKEADTESQVCSGKKGSAGLMQNPVWRNLKSIGESEVGSVTKNPKCTEDCNQDANTLVSSKVVDDGMTDLERKSLMKLGHCQREIYDASSLKLPLALPLPKAPSESWLSRTLPTVSSRNISPWSNLASKNHVGSQSPKTALLDPKWELIVKSSNVQLGHLRFGEEPLAPIPEA